MVFERVDRVVRRADSTIIVLHQTAAWNLGVWSKACKNVKISQGGHEGFSSSSAEGGLQFGAQQW